MSAFTPVNSLETALRTLLTDRNTPLWNFYTPLAAAPLWVIVQHHPELDGSDLVAPPGQNPGLCILQGPNYSCIGLFTSPGRAQEAFTKLKLSRHDWTVVSAPGYQLLKLVRALEVLLWINAGLKECQYQLDPDMVEILLSRPEPQYADAPARNVVRAPAGDPEKHLSALRDFLRQQPKVRAAWIFGQKPELARSGSNPAYELNLVMEDPEDKSLLPEVEVMLKALTPVEMEWTTGVMMADDQSFRNLTKQHPPFYARPDFLKS